MPAPASARPLRAVIYGRVSTEGQREGTSLRHQDLATSQWCHSHGVAIAQRQFEVESGADAEREGLVRLRVWLEAGDITHLVATRPDRVTRNLKACSDLWDLAMRLRFQLVFVDDGRVFDPAADPLAVEPWMNYMLHGVIAEEERRLIRTRVRGGLRKRVAEGLRLGRPPLGYRMVRQPGGRPQLEIEPAGAAVVRQLFTAAAAGGSLGEVAGLAQRLWPQRRWPTSAVGRLLANPIYAGRPTLTYEKRPLDLAGQVPAIVDEACFAAAQAQRRDRRQRLRWIQGQSNAASLLGGIARCSCGEPMVGVPGEGVYRCRTWRPWHPGCGAPAVSMGLIDVMVVDQLHQLLVCSQTAMADLVQGALDRLPRHLDAERGVAAGVLAGIDTEMEQLDGDLESGRCTVATYKARMTGLTARRSQAGQALAETTGRQVFAQLLQMLGGQRWFAWDMLWMATRPGPPDWTPHRELIAALCSRITIPARPARSAEDVDPAPALVEVELHPDAAIRHELLDAAARVLLRIASMRNLDPAESLRAAGYVAEETADGRHWRHPQHPELMITENRLELEPGLADGLPKP